MNIYFFLNHLNFDSSLDIFNFPPNKKFCSDEIKDIYPYAFYSNGQSWIYHSLEKIKKNNSQIIKKVTYRINFTQSQFLFPSL